MTSSYFFEFTGSAPWYAFDASKLGIFYFVLNRQNLAAHHITVFIRYRDFPSFIHQFSYWLAVNEAVSFLIIFFKTVCRYSLKSSITPWSTLTTENLFEIDYTVTPFFWYKNIFLSLFNLFNPCKWLITGHK
jgi:hypothetical protein